MKKPLLLATALLLGSTALVGSVAAATHALGEHHSEHGDRDRAGTSSVDADGRVRVADRDHHRGHDRHDRKGKRHHDDDDDDDDHDGGRGAGRQPVTGPTDPNAPVPDNGLFQGKSRPKVEVN